MTQSTRPDPESSQPSTRRRRVRLHRTLVIIGVTTLGAVGVAGWLTLRSWVYTRLVPLVEQSTLRLIERPLELGDVQGFSLIGIRFGETVLPPTATDADRAIVEEVLVRFNLLDILFSQSLKLRVTLVHPIAVIDQDASGQWIATQFQTLEPGVIDLSIDSVFLEDARVALIPYPDGNTDESARAVMPFDRPADWPPLEAGAVILDHISGVTHLRDDNQRIAFDLSGEPMSGGSFDVEGELNRENGLQARATLRTQRLDLASLAPLMPPLPVTLESGYLNSNLGIQLGSQGQVALEGITRFWDMAVTREGLPVTLADGSGRVRFSGREAQLEGVRFELGESTLTAKGSVHFGSGLQEGYDLTVQGRSLDIANVLDTLEVQPPIPLAGQLQAEAQVTGPLDQPVVNGTINHRTPIQIDRIDVASLGARFRLNAEALELNLIEARLADGGLMLGNGRVSLRSPTPLDFSINLTDVAGDAIAQRYLDQPLPDALQIGPVGATVQVGGTLSYPWITAQWAAPQATYPTQGELTLVGDRLQLTNTTVEVAEGTVTADAEASLSEGQWQAIATLNQISLRPFLSNQPGEIDGEVQLAGDLRNWDPAAIEAEGRVNLSEVPILEEPLTTDFRWVGDGIELREAIAPSLRASGFIATRLEGEGAPTITSLDLTVDADDLNLERINPFLPDSIRVAGLADLAGQLTGTLERPALTGAVALQNFVVNGEAFEPQMNGTVQFALGEGGQVDVAGERDRIAATLNAQYRPTGFFIQRNETVAQGRTEGDRLRAEVTNFPLSVLNLQPAAGLGLGAAGGWLTGTVAIDLSTFDPANPNRLTASGDVAIANPSLGHIEGDRFAGRFIYQNGNAILTGGQLQVGRSEYDVVGRLAPTSETLFRGQITATDGGVQDLLVAFKYFEIADLIRFLDPPQYDRAGDVEPIPIRISDTPLLRQLQRYSEIARLRDLQQAAQEEAQFFPELRELDGTFSGTIDVVVSRQEGLSADFNLTGENWEWGEYDDPNQMVAQGNFSNNTLTLLPFRFASGETQINFAGQIGQAEDSAGQLRIENVSADLVADFLRLPLDIQGNVNATATLTGSITNPQARGEFSLTEGSLNQTPIQEADARFSYADARLNLIGEMQIADSDPIRATGSVPYQLPQGTVPPASDEISLDIRIEDEGLAVLNILNNQVAWEGGEATVILQVGGTLRQTPDGVDLRPLATGFAELRGGTFSARVLPEPLTDVTGTIQFIRDRIQVDSLRGQFSDGEFTAQGVIPLAEPLTEAEAVTPLAVNLTDLAVNFKGLYDGGVEGRIIVGGTALAPELGGDVILSNGRVSLPDPTAIAGVASAPTGTVEPLAAIVSPPELDNLRVILGDRLLITRAPILNFVATGDLVVSGPLNDFRSLRPDGQIRLRSGQVNVFTTQFNLDRGYDNVAIFRPNDGVDPLLDLRLSTSVLEQTRSPIAPSTPYAQSEIADPSAIDFASIQTIRIEATVQGPASQIFDNIELSSSPSRSQNEIIALIGGGFNETQGRGDGTLAIANLAGTALFTSIQTLVSNALGFSDFRIFPTVITSDEREEGGGDRPSSTLGLAAELGVNLTSNLSLSVLQLLTVQEPTQFNLRYRLDDQWLLRGSTNLSDESRIVLEYEARF